MRAWLPSALRRRLRSDAGRSRAIWSHRVELLEGRLLFASGIINGSNGSPPFPFGFTGADFDNDGVYDFVSTVVQGFQSGTSANPNYVAVYRGPTPLVIERTYTFNFTTADAQTADFNGDGKMDFILQAAAGPLVIFFGNGDLTFSPTTLGVSVPLPPGPGAGSGGGFSVGDVNGDGRPDIVVAENNHGVGPDRLIAALNDGSGGFTTISNDLPGAPGPLAVSVADLNGDGKLDAVVADTQGYTDTYLGNGKGTFTFQSFTRPGITASPRVVLADLNRDGRPDLLEGSDGGPTVMVALNQGSGRFGASITALTSAVHFNDIAAADMNRDGYMDIVALGQNVRNGVGSLVIAPGRGDGTFDAPTSISLVSTAGTPVVTPIRMTVGDFDGDGDSDVASSNQYNHDPGFYINPTPPDRNPPTALVAASDLAARTVGRYAFSVTWTDEHFVDRSTLGSGDLLVSGPNGYQASARLDSISTGAQGNRKQIVATYSIPAPVGGWGATGNGVYTISTVAGQVSDAIGNTTVAGTAGSFKVAIGDVDAPTAAMPSIAPITAASSTPLTITVTYADNQGILRSTVGAGDLNVTGPNGFSASAVFVSATPAANVRSITATYSIAAPGGAWDTADNGEYSIFLLADAVTDTSANAVPAGLIGAFAVSIAPPPVDPPPVDPPPAPSPPVAVFVPGAAVTVTGGTSYWLVVNYSDDVAINAATLDGSDLIVTGPSGALAVTLSQVTPAGSGAALVATYSVTPPGGQWDSSDNGAYLVHLAGGQVRDTAGTPAEPQLLGTFTVLISPDPVLVVYGGAGILASGAAVDAGESAVGQVPRSVSVTIYNAGERPLEIDLSAASMPDGFVLVSPPSSVIVSLTSTTFWVRLDTAAFGAKAGDLTFATNDPHSPEFTLHLTGVVRHGPELVVRANGVAGTSLSFPRTPALSGTTPPQTFTLLNTGDAPLHVTNFGLGGRDGADFRVALFDAAGKPLTLGAGGTFEIAVGGSVGAEVRFAPMAGGARSGALTFNSDDLSDGESSVVLTLTGEADGPAVAVTADRTFESSSSMVFWFSIVSPSSAPVVVHYSTADGGALAGQDFTAAAGDAVIPVGATSVAVSVGLINDAIHESDESFTLQLSAVSNATTQALATGTIVDDDSAVLSIADASTHEGGGTVALGTLEFVVSLPAPIDHDVMFDYVTEPGTASPGADYLAVSGTATVFAGQTSATISVQVAGDRDREDNEVLYLALSNTRGAGVSLARSFATGTIVDDDADAPVADVSAPTVRVKSVLVPGGRNGELRITVVFEDEAGLADGVGGDGDLLVSGPRGYVATMRLLRKTRSGDGRMMTATYVLAGRWADRPRGAYAIKIASGHIFDGSGNAVAGRKLAGFRWNG